MSAPALNVGVGRKLTLWGYIANNHFTRHSTPWVVDRHPSLDKHPAQQSTVLVFAHQLNGLPGTALLQPTCQPTTTEPSPPFDHTTHSAFAVVYIMVTDDTPSVSVAVGIIVGLVASLVQSLGLTIQRKSHILNDKLPEGERKVEHRRPYVSSFPSATQLLILDLASR